MKLREICAWIAFASISYMLFLAIDSFRIQLCEYSIYKTNDYRIINGNLYCRSSGNSFQLLTKYKPRSKHLDAHKAK